MKMTLKRVSGQQGFSLIEMMAVLAILTVIIAPILAALNTAQKRNKTESAKLDTIGQAREAMDQMIRDLHQTGYPSLKLYSFLAGTTVPVNQYSNGIVAPSGLTSGSKSAFNNPLSMQADADGGSQVQVINYQLVPTVSGATSCPCTLQRSQDALVASGTQPATYSTLAENVNSLTFDAKDGYGNTPTQLSSIKTLIITMTVGTTSVDIDTQKQPNVTLTSSVTFNN